MVRFAVPWSAVVFDFDRDVTVGEAGAASELAAVEVGRDADCVILVRDTKQHGNRPVHRFASLA